MIHDIYGAFSFLLATAGPQPQPQPRARRNSRAYFGGGRRLQLAAASCSEVAPLGKGWGPCLVPAWEHGDLIQNRKINQPLTFR